VTATALLADLTCRGVELRPDGDRLRWRAPAGVVTEQDLAALRAVKVELLALLEPPPAWLERRSREWLLHLREHDPHRADLALARELAEGDWRLAQAREPGSVQ
jgi:hypothetical protein